MTAIEPGSTVLVRTADDRLLDKRALTAPVMGEDFPVVWVCREEEWNAAQLEGREPEGVPWPAEDVAVVEGASELPHLREGQNGEST